MDFLQNRVPGEERGSGTKEIRAVKEEEEAADQGSSSVQTSTFSGQTKAEPPGIKEEGEEWAVGVKEEPSPVQIGAGADSPAEIEVDLGSESEESSENRPRSHSKGRKRAHPFPQQQHRKRPRKLWREEDMVRALEGVSAGMTIRYAAHLFNVPRNTLGDRVCGRVTHGCRTGPRLLLAPEDERVLVQYCLYCAQHGFPLTKARLLVYASAIRRKRNPAEHLLPLGKKWWHCFRRRHAAELGILTDDKIHCGRAVCAKQRRVGKYFDLLSSTLEQYGLTNKPSHIYSCDETGFKTDGTQVKVLQAPGTLDHVSVLACFNAVGEDIPPFIIFDKHFPEGPYTQGGPPNALYGKSPVGNIDSELFQRWFAHFIRHARKERPLLLIFDGHKSHLAPDVVEAARKEDVVLLCLPLRCSHVLQPLNVGLFGPLNAEFAELAELAEVAGDLCHFEHSFVVNKTEFAKVFHHLYQQLKNQGIVVDGFRKCGIFPLNPHAVDLNRLMLPAGLRSNTTTSPQDSATPSSSSSSSPVASTSSHSPAASALDHPLVQQV